MGLGHSPFITTNGLVLCYDFASTKSYPGSGTTVTDTSGFGNTGTLQGSPTINSQNLGSLSLNGSTQRINVSLSASTVRVYDSTVHFIIKLPNYDGGQRAILSYRYSGGGPLYIGKAGRGIFCYYDSLTSNGSGAPGWTFGNITNNTVAICAVTLDATNGVVSTYINGSLAGSTTRNGGWSASYGTAMNLGYDSGTTEWMLGDFYHFLHYNRVLTAAEISQNFNALKGRFGI